MIFDVCLGSGFVPPGVRGTEGLSDRLFFITLFMNCLDPWWLAFEKSLGTQYTVVGGPVDPGIAVESIVCWEFLSTVR